MAVTGAAAPPARRQEPVRRRAPARPVPAGEHRAAPTAAERTRRRRAHALIALAAIILLGALFAVVAGQAEVSTQQIRLANLNSELTSVAQSNANLQLERAELAAPGRILQLAQTRLHMVVPTKVTYLVPVAPGESVAAADASR